MFRLETHGEETMGFGRSDSVITAKMTDPGQQTAVQFYYCPHKRAPENDSRLFR